MQSYLITDPKQYSNNPNLFYDTLKTALLKHRPDFVCFRDKQSENYAELASVFLQCGREVGQKNLFINTHFELAISLGADGVHLNSSQHGLVQKAKDAGLQVVASCHSLDEIKACEIAGADYATISPIFASEGKGVPLGVEKLREIVHATSLKLFALGGVASDEHMRQVQSSGVFGFASIRWFLK